MAVADAAVARLIGKAIARHRNAIGVSQEELSVRAGIHRTAVSQLERGERIPRADTVIKLAASMGIPAGDLLNDIGWQPIAYSSGGFRFPGDQGGQG